MTGEPNDSGATLAPETQPDKQTGEAKFTQADIDRILAERLRRAEEATHKKLLGELGVDTLDTAKNSLKAHSEAEAAKKSELDKWADKYAKLEAKHTELNTRLEQALTERKLDKRNAAVAKALTEAKATDIDDLMAIIEKHYGDELASVLSAEGAVDDKALKGLVETVKKGRAKFFASAAPGSPSNNNGRVPQPNSKVELTGRSRF